MKTSKKYEALNALANIRDYLRQLQHELGKANPEKHSQCVPLATVEDFNLVAKRLGADTGWMIYGIGS